MADIWIVSAYTPALSQPGAARNRHHQFARALNEQGHRVVIFCSGVSRNDGRSRLAEDPANAADSRYESVSDNGVTTRQVRGREYTSESGRFLDMIHFDWSVARSTEGLPPPDLVMGTTVHHFAAHAAQRLARRHRVPFLLEVGDIWPQTLVDIGALSKVHPVYWVLRGLEVFLYRRADRILSKLPLASRHVADSHADPGKVVYLPNASEFEPYLAAGYPDAPPERAQFVVVYAGSMSPAYALSNAVDAAALVAKLGLPIIFRFIGSGSVRDGLIEQGKRLGLTNLEFVDLVPYDEVPRQLADADACLASAQDLSVIRNFGMSQNKVYEYMGAGRPILFAIGSANDPVAEAGAGVSVPPEDAGALAAAVVELYEASRAERQAMGKRGQDYVRDRFTYDAMSSRFTRIVDEVLAGMDPGSLVDPDDVRA